jgi:acetoacetate decarboxylase
MKQKETTIPKEILSYMPPPPFTFPLAKYYVTTFRTDQKALSDILPDMVVPMPGSEDLVLLQVNNFATYWEAVVSLPVIFKSGEKDVPGIYLSQLYLGSIVPEGSSLPMLLGQIGAGYPKRDAIFTVQGFSEEKAQVKFERWGSTIAEMDHEMGEAITDFSDLPFGSDLSNLTAFLFKAVPKSDGSGFDALQLTTPQGADGEIVKVNKVKTTFKGDVVLDSGRVLPVKEQLYSLYYEIKDAGLTHAEILVDYLAE